MGFSPARLPSVRTSTSSLPAAMPSPALLLLLLLTAAGAGQAAQECEGDVCYETGLGLHYTRARTAGSLQYQELGLATASSRALAAACFPATNSQNFATKFKSCDGPLQEVCELSKRGWLVRDGNGETAANLESLTAALAGVAGADVALADCMNVNTNQYDGGEDYEYYDYAYYDAYDYRLVRAKRDTQKRQDETKTKKKTDKASKKLKKREKKMAKKAKKADKKAAKRAKKVEKKALKKAARKAEKEGKENETKGLEKLGLSAMPKKSTMTGLRCLKKSLMKLLLKCGEKMLSA